MSVMGQICVDSYYFVQIEEVVDAVKTLTKTYVALIKVEKRLMYRKYWLTFNVDIFAGMQTILRVLTYVFPGVYICWIANKVDNSKGP